MGDIRLYSTEILGCVVPGQCQDIGELIECGATIALFEEHDGCGNGGGVVNDETGVTGDIVVTLHRPYDLVFTYGGFRMSISVIARGDFTGDGVEEFLAEYSYSPTPEALGGGSGTGLSNASMVILKRPPGQDAIAF
jgi:hypothetical protein